MEAGRKEGLREEKRPGRKEKFTGKSIYERGRVRPGSRGGRMVRRGKIKAMDSRVSRE